MSDVFRIDIPELKPFERKWGELANPSLMRELTNAFIKGGQIAQHESNVLIKGGESSNLAKASKATTVVTGSSLTTTVDWSGARSATGFPYAAAVNTGRIAFGPVTAKALHFVIDGRDIFTQHVKAFAGTKFISRGLATAKPKILSEVKSAVGRWRAQM